ncbi:MAG: alpha/beta hydrolase [bacterium]|nr:alpha/beta hydrolase [bacterium]
MSRLKKPVISLVLIGIAIATLCITLVLFHNVLQSRQDKRFGELAIDESLTLNINGTQQWVRLRGASATNPLLLIIHGGPGLPSSPLATLTDTTLVKHFTVVHWDQRGAGKSFKGDNTLEATQIATYVNDAKSLIRQLQEMMAVKKMFVLGYSWGSVIGFKIAQEHPDWLHAYIGVGQIGHFAKSEQESYETALALSIVRKDTDAQDELEELGPPPYLTAKALLMERKWVQNFGGFYRGKDNKKIVNLFTAATMSSPDYTFRDILNWMSGMNRSLDKLLPAWNFVNLETPPATINTPFYVISGVEDFTITHSTSYSLFKSVKAPKGKTFFRFPKSAHMPFLEEPQRFLDTLLRVKREAMGTKS